MGDYYSDKHAGGESYAQHREIARSNERVRNSISPNSSPTTGQTAGDSGGGLVLLVFAGSGIAWYNWDEILVSLTQSTNDLIGALLQNWFWLSAFPLGILFLLSGFAKRANAWKNPSKSGPEILMLLGTALLISGKMDSGYGDKIIWYSPFIMGAISILVLYFFIQRMEQPERFVIKSPFASLIIRLMVLPFVAIFISFLFFFIVAIIAIFGFDVQDNAYAMSAEAIILTVAYVASWPLCFYLACQQG